MAADFAVGTKFTASNKMGTVYRSMSKNTNKFAAQTERAFGRASRSASNFGAVVKGIITTDVLRRGTMLMQRGLEETGREFVSFDDALTQAAAKFPEKISRGSDAFYGHGGILGSSSNGSTSRYCRSGHVGQYRTCAFK